MKTWPVINGAEAWSSEGRGERSRTGIVVVHGFTGNPTSTRPLGQSLAEHGFSVEVSRLPGHGTHWKDMKRTRYRDWRGEIERASRRLAERCDRVILVGISMGGTLVLDVGSSTPPPPRLAGVMAINAQILDLEGILPRLAPLVSKLVSTLPAKAAGLVKNDAARPGVDERAYKRFSTKAAQSVISALPRVRSQLRKLSVPVTVAYSPQDHCVSPDNSLAIPALVGSATRVKLVKLEQSFHLATLDYDCDLLLAEVIELAEGRARAA